jgi:uncharacterized delta-60 repeat protein
VDFSPLEGSETTKDRPMKLRAFTDNQIRLPGPRTIFPVLVSLALCLTGNIAHAQSALDGFNPGANNTVNVLAVQADGKILVGGDFTALGGGMGATMRNHIGRMNPDGTVDTTFNAGANGKVLAIAVQADGKIVVGGLFTMLDGGGGGTTTRNRIGRLNPDGSLDTSFDPGADSTVAALALQADGKILVGGDFSTFGGGGTGTSARNKIARLNPDGSLDTAFDPSADIYVDALAVQRDGKILVAGDFSTLGGATRHNIGRLNPDGSLDTSFDPGTNSAVLALAVQADGKIVVGGNFSTLGGGGTGTTTRDRIGRLNSDGTLDATFNPGADGDVMALAVQTDGKILVGGSFAFLGGPMSFHGRIGRLHPSGVVDIGFSANANGNVLALAVQADGKILAGGSFSIFDGSGRFNISRLYPNGLLDTNFDPGANDLARALVMQADGKILAGGSFTTLGGGGLGTTTRSRIGRLNPDGTLDASFNPGANSIVLALAVQEDGKILVGGDFTGLGGGMGLMTRNRIGRLNADGTVDTAFNPGANDRVRVLVVQPDGKILVGGDFTGFNGMPPVVRNRLARLNADGTVDTTFNPDANNSVLSLAVQADGKILVGGNFTGFNGMPPVVRNHLARLNSDGTLDASFNPGANGAVYALAVQPDGKILVSGNFITLGGGGVGTTTRNRIGRLNPDGTLDSTFNPGTNNIPYTLAVQANGDILAAGDFTTLGGGGIGVTTRNHLGRLHSDGTVDVTFDPGANSSVYALALQTDGKILAGGLFTTIGGGGTGTVMRSRIARLSNSDAALQELTLDPSAATITWHRGGTSPEVDRATFELSADGTNYSTLTNPSRIADGWQLTGLSLPTQQNIFIRARGFYSSGWVNGSRSIVETVRNAFIVPLIPPTPVQVVSLKTHGASDFGINLPLTGTPGVECRSGGATSDYKVVITFANAVTVTGGPQADVTTGIGDIGTNGLSNGGAVEINGAVVTVSLTNVFNAQTIAITLFNVSDGTNTGNVTIPMSVLIGDTTGNGIVSSSDISQTKLRTGQVVGESNFRSDITANGAISSADVSLAKSKSGTGLP